MIYELPTTVEVNGNTYAIRSDYRAILDICIALNDPELSDQERAYIVLNIFYEDISTMPKGDYQEAVERCFWFIDRGDDDGDSDKKAPRLVDWEQDFKLIVAPVNRVMGREIRAVEYMHWWTFLSAYMEIGGDCTFAQVVGIREKLAKHKKLDKSEKEWMRKNQKLVLIKTKYTQAEDDFIKQWI